MKTTENLENEWLSFESMISGGGVTGNTDEVKQSDFLVNGIVAYPGMKSQSRESVNENGNLIKKYKVCKIKVI